jgi:hypothetical protein
MPLVALLASNRYSRSDSRQVFEGKCLARYDGFLDQSLADAVIYVFLEAALPARVLAQPTLGVLRANLLQSLPTAMIAGADLLHSSSAKRLTVTIGGQIHNP